MYYLQGDFGHEHCNTEQVFYVIKDLVGKIVYLTALAYKIPDNLVVCKNVS